MASDFSAHGNGMSFVMDDFKSTKSVARQETKVRSAASPSPSSDVSPEVPIISVEHVSLDYKKEKEPLPVLVDVSLAARKDEFVVITGPSGCGKSSLLRIIAGLNKPTSGRVLFRGTPVTEPRQELAMIFQNFVLLPWRTALENVLFGLVSRKDISEEKKKELAMRALDDAGLKGFENVYPGELSGGMKQRVGIARALATAEHLRKGIYSLLINPSSPIQTVLMVSHNVEEIVELADKVVVLSPRPGHVVGELTVGLPRPRNKKSKEFFDWVDMVYSLLA